MAYQSFPTNHFMTWVRNSGTDFVGIPDHTGYMKNHELFPDDVEYLVLHVREDGYAHLTDECGHHHGDKSWPSWWDVTNEMHLRELHEVCCNGISISVLEDESYWTKFS